VAKRRFLRDLAWSLVQRGMEQAPGTTGGAMYTHENGKWERLRMPQQPDRHIESHALVFLLSYTGSEYLIYGFRKKKLMDENVNNNTLENSAQRNNTLEN
jgi:hypothetical protein